MPTVNLGTTTPRQILGQTVYTKAAWADAWTAQPHMFCTMANWSAAPRIGSAELYFRYGRGFVAGSTTASTISPFSLPTFAYVKIEFDVLDSGGSETPMYWYGIIGSVVDNRGGTSVSAARQGVQSLTAMSLEWLLDRRDVVHSVFVLAHSVDEIKSAARGFTFNETKNRSTTKKTATHMDAYVFEDSQVNNWSTRDIVEYLIAFHSPTDWSGIRYQDWTLSDSAGVLPVNDAPVLVADHLSVWQLLNQLIARERGMGFQVYVTDPNIFLYPFSFAQTDLALPTGDTLPANVSQITLTTTADRGGVLHVIDRFDRFNRVKLIGARAIHCFSVPYGNDGFAPGWDSGEQLNYRAGASAHANYPQPTEVAARQRMNTLARALPNHPNAYRRFVVTLFQDPFVLLFSPPEQRRYVFPDDMHLMPSLPLHEGLDYSAGQTPAHDKKRPYIEPFISFLVPGGDPANPKFIHGSNNRSLLYNEGANFEFDNHTFSVNVHAVDNDPGTFYLAVSGAPRHVIDGKNFNKLDEDEDPGQFTYEQAWVTLAFEWDYYCEVIYPVPGDPGEPERMRVIEMGAEFQLHFLCGHTVVAIDEANDRLWSDHDRYIRDDRDILEDYARLAYQWYATDRNSIRLTTEHVSNLLDIGDLIVTLDGTTVNTCITSMTLTSHFGQAAKPPSFQYETSHSELSFGLIYQSHKGKRLP